MITVGLRVCLGACLMLGAATGLAQTPGIFNKVLPAIELLLMDETTLSIATPADHSSVTSATVTVTGTLGGKPGLTVRANMIPGTVSGTDYSVAGVPLSLGLNTITVTASDGPELLISTSITVTRVNAPTVSITSPQNNVTVFATPLAVTGTYTNATQVTVNGQSAQLNAGVFSASVPLSLGSNVITAVASNAGGQATDARTVTYALEPKATWDLPAAEAGLYHVAARWVADSGNSSAATFTVVHAGGSTPVVVNQQAQDGQWVTLGSFNLAPNQNHRVELRPVVGGAVVADAVRITRDVPTNVQVFNVYADHLDTPRLLTRADATEQVVWRWDNDDAFGANAPDENPSQAGTFVFNLRLPGQYFDKETNLHYNYQRDAYDPAIGRFTQPEPLGLAGDINLYRYARNNPLTYFDPDGRQATAVLGVVGGAGASTATVGGGAAVTGAGAAGSTLLMSPAVAVTGAGLLGYGIGTLAYPIIEPQLSKGIDWICSTVAGSRTERCNEAFRNCKGWRQDPKWIDRCARALMECLNHPGLPVIFPNGDIVK